ncbi:Atrophin-1 multi-domain protein [Herbaspirillum sp. DW155]|uniref:Atrophin-1 multi-domain protein n=1 Tax=Herbaspirillum sp. DW155 TaxID=3095609 RepID=UPI0030852EC0|nr:Atrophin-1 multi-domain protein [Herbaspirillum sp. DW155]
MQRKSRTIRHAKLCLVLSCSALTCMPGWAEEWGTYLKPFAADSLWNSRPINPTFSNDVIPTSDYYPLVTNGAYSTGIFLATPNDPPVTVTGPTGSNSLKIADEETFHDITIPHWPAATTPAPGGDAHADIVDPSTGIIHSFWGLAQQDGKWTARLYAWTKLNGSGWPDPAHYYQGARATGIPAGAGLIRTHEAAAKPAYYPHALGMSLTFNALAADPAYVFPSTSADAHAKALNTGTIPEGALMMLPPSFDTSKITNEELRRIAETLKRYGAYVVDANRGTPFAIYAEIGSAANPAPNGWNAVVGNELQTIRAALRRVTGASGWVDGNGKPFTPNQNLNLLSMRGAWTIQSGSGQAKFSSWDQAVVFSDSSSNTVAVNYSNRGMQAVNWAKPVIGKNYKLTARTTGGAKLRLTIYDKLIGKVVTDSGYLGNGQSTVFSWTANTPQLIIYAQSGGANSSVGAELLKAD